MKSACCFWDMVVWCARGEQQAMEYMRGVVYLSSNAKRKVVLGMRCDSCSFCTFRTESEDKLFSRRCSNPSPDGCSGRLEVMFRFDGWEDGGQTMVQDIKLGDT